MRSRLVVVVALAAVAGLAMPAATLAIAPKTQFAYTGGEQSYTVPPGVVMVGLAVKGGRGGDNGEGGGHEGGVGALLPVTPGEQLYVEVAAAGVYGGTSGVFGGGGAPGAPPPVLAFCGQATTLCGGDYASSGGGASDVRTCSISAPSCPGGGTSASTRVIVGGGGGGRTGSGNGPGYTCAPIGGAGRANTFQYLPGNPSVGPVPIVTAAGTVYPGWNSASGDQIGSFVTPAGGGSDSAGAGGSLAPCSESNSTGWTDSIAGSAAAGGTGGTGGNASSLGPDYANCTLAADNCDDAGAGGGGGGGYFGGGGGSTGYNQPVGCGSTCNGATAGEGGAGGSSFISSLMQDPLDESSLAGAPAAGVAMVVPVFEIDTPANGAVYAKGQVVHASYSCGYDPVSGLGTSTTCSAPVASGAAIDTSPGSHTFTVTGSEYSNGYHAVSASVTYTVGAAHSSVRGSLGGFRFTLSGGGSTCVPPGGKLPLTLAKSGTGRGYRVRSFSYWVGGGHAPALVTRHAGAVKLPIGRSSAGSHTVKLVITLRSDKAGETPKRRTLLLKLTFAIC